jgi:hypothetical protein
MAWLMLASIGVLIGSLALRRRTIGRGARKP